MHRLNQNDDDKKYVRELVDLVYSTIEGYEKYLLDEINHSDLSRIMVSLKDHTDNHGSYLK